MSSQQKIWRVCSDGRSAGSCCVFRKGAIHLSALFSCSPTPLVIQMRYVEARIYSFLLTNCCWRNANFIYHVFSHKLLELRREMFFFSFSFKMHSSSIRTNLILKYINANIHFPIRSRRLFPLSGCVYSSWVVFSCLTFFVLFFY